MARASCPWKNDDPRGQDGPWIHGQDAHATVSPLRLLMHFRETLGTPDGIMSVGQGMAGLRRLMDSAVVLWWMLSMGKGSRRLRTGGF